jgi:uncharacterized membrane protein YraQ (UPF0718 family)
MDYRTGKMKKVKKKVRMMLKDLWENIKEVIYWLLFAILFVSLVFYFFTTLLLLAYSEVLSKLIPFFVAVYSVFFSVIFGIFVDKFKSRREIKELKSTILLELRHILISLIENFTQFYEVYFAVLRLFKFDLKWFHELTEKYRKYFPDYLMNEIKILMFVYENLDKSKQSKQEDIEKTIKFLEEYIREMKLRSQCPTMGDVHHYFEKEGSGDRENKPSINPIHMALLSSTLNKLSALDKNFVENILYIWHEINKLNKEIEVLKGLSRTDPILICSISQRIEKIAIKIDEIFEKEGTNL